MRQQVFFNLFQNAPIAFAVVNLDGTLQLVNKHFLGWLGYSQEEIPGVHFKDITHPADISSDLAFYEKLVSGKIINYEIEKRYITKSGRIVWGRLYATLVTTSEGTPLHFTGIIQDITHSKTAENALLNSERRYKAVLDHSNEMICRYSLDFKLTYGNKSFLKFFNLSQNDLENLNVLDLIPDKSELEKFKQSISHLKKTKEAVLMETSHETAEGKIWQQWTSVGIYNNNGDLIELQAIGRDITKEKEEKEYIAEHNKVLTQYTEELNSTNNQLADLTQLFDSVQRNTKTGIWNLVLSSDYIFWSDEIYRIHELDEKRKLTIEEVLSYYDLEHQILVREIFYEAIQQKKEFDYELKIITAKNNIRWVRVIASPVNEKGVVSSIQGIFQDITDKKLAQLKAQERQENINAIIENTVDHIWSIDRNYNLIVANTPFKKMLKSMWGREIIEGESMLLYEFPSDFKSLWKSFYDRALSGESFKTVRRPRNDNSLVLDVNFNPIYDNGRVVGANIISRDITEIKKKEAEIERQQEYLLQVQSEAKIGAWRRNYTTETLEYTNTLREIFELDDGDINPDNILDIMNNMIHPEDQEEINQIIKRVRTTEDKSIFVESRIITKNGNIKYIRAIGGETYKDPVSGDTIQPGSTQDVTSFKVQEQRLLENEQQVKSLTNNSFLGVALVDFEGNFLQANQTFTSILGYSQHDIEYCTVKELTHPEDRANTADYFKLLKDGIKDAHQTEKRYLRKDGQVVWALLNVSVVKNAKKQPIYLLGQFQDITDRKNEEVRIKKIVEERTIQLKAINKELESFSYSVSHDLRAPLRSVNGFSEALLEDYSHILDDEGNLFLNKIYDASVRMGDLIDDLLHLSRISRYECLKQKVNLSTLAQQVISSISIKDVYANTKFNIEEDLWCEGDGQMLTILLENLIGNACKYSSNKKLPEVCVGKKIIDDKMVIYIKDNGVGFNMAYAGNLFHAFQRLHSDEQFEGTGIGLATVKKIIDRHQGKIWAEAKENEGATFFFQI